MDIKTLPKIEAVIKDDGKSVYAVIKHEDYKRFIQKLSVKGKIDENDYVARYPKIGELIQQKKFKSATDHYLKAGYVDQRKATIVG